jgi:tetratricopeptide (TPR) repeat protein
VVLYNRYTEDTNAAAIDHFRAAAESADPKLRALSLAGLTIAYAQNVHRFGLEPELWIALADEASAEAVEIDADLEESIFARGWAHQLNHRTADAIKWYEQVIDLPGDSASERQVKSFAQNNRAYLVMTERDDLSTAEDLFRDALARFPNKMAHANLGEIHRRRQEFELGLDEYHEALRLDPRYANAMNEMGILFLAWAASKRDVDASEAASLLTQAEQCHTRALALVPPTATHQLEALRKSFETERREHASDPSPEELAPGTY